MRALAGDIEEMVAVGGKDLSRPQAYLRIVGIYHEVGDADKALEWAEEVITMVSVRNSPIRQTIGVGDGTSTARKITEHLH